MKKIRNIIHGVFEWAVAISIIEAIIGAIIYAKCKSLDCNYNNFISESSIDRISQFYVAILAIIIIDRAVIHSPGDKVGIRILKILGLVLPLFLVVIFFIAYKDCKRPVPYNGCKQKVDYAQFVADSTENILHRIFAEKYGENIAVDSIRIQNECISTKDSILATQAEGFISKADICFSSLIKTTDSILLRKGIVKKIIRISLLKNKLLTSINDILEMGGNQKMREDLFKDPWLDADNTMIVDEGPGRRSVTLNSYLAMGEGFPIKITKIDFDNDKISRIYFSK